MNSNGYYQNSMHIQPQTSPEELNIFGLYLAYEASTEQCGEGISDTDNCVIY